MDKSLFYRIVLELDNCDLDDFSYEHEGKRYMFKEVGDDSWDDQGKYQYKEEQGRLVEIDENYKELKEFNYAVSRTVQRSGSYFSDYYYDHEPYTPIEIVEVVVPEVIIPEHTKEKWVNIRIPEETIEEIKREEDEKAKLELENRQREEEEKKKQAELAKKYSMNNPTIIQEVNKKLQKRKTFTIQDMRQEYFNIVESQDLEGEDWLEYHRKNTLE